LFMTFGAEATQTSGYANGFKVRQMVL